jgi:hypothetical protein
MKYTNLIYGLRDPRNDVYRYIGKTTVGVSRPLSHLIKSHNKSVNNWVEELSFLGLKPIVDIIEDEIKIDELSTYEKRYISYYSDLHGQLFNGGSRIYECINEPSIIENSDIESVIKTLSNPNEIYKMIKTSTGFCDSTIACMLNIGRKTIYSIKESNQRIMMGTILRLIFFCKYTMNDVFNFYIKKSNEFKGDWPDDYDSFMNKCIHDESFIRVWCNKFYEDTIKISKVTYNKRAKKRSVAKSVAKSVV